MCGIAGFISPDAGESLESRKRLLDSMCRVITHRGPDEQGTVVRGRAALGMRRLSIIDLKTGQQPIFTPDERFAIVFNGEIYNYRELKNQLESKGYQFRTNSDTETILYAYQEFGSRCVEYLRGMFAIAIWDFNEDTLFLARDRVGKKPLFYAILAEGTIAFGSELKSLMLHPRMDREIDLASVDAYLAFGYVPENRCIFRVAQKLGPGQTLTFRDGKAVTERYWQFPYMPNERMSEVEICETLLNKLRDAVKVRLLSEVPLGAFLSGGIDSSAVVGMMSELSSEPVKTFSIGFNEDAFNELKYARLAANHFKTEHHEFIVTPDLIDVVDQIVGYFDEPFSDSSALPTYMLAKLAREHVTVVLSGDGGDELFGGYSRYQIAMDREWSDHIPSIGKRLLNGIGMRVPHRTPGKNYIYNHSLDRTGRYIDLVSHFNLSRRKKLYSTDMLESLDDSFGNGERDYRALMDSSGSDDAISKMLSLDSSTYLPSDVMTKVDRMTMANSIEARSPLLDQKLIEFAGTIPPSLKLRNGQTKYILKKALKGLVPREILYRKKQGFGVPIVEWINAELRLRIRETLMDGSVIKRGYFNTSFIEMLLREHAEHRRDHSHALWSLFMLELWVQKYVQR